MRINPTKTTPSPVPTDRFKYLFQIYDVVSRVFRGELRSIMQLHSSICILIGMGALVLPHHFFSSSTGYNHFAHEFVRLYGCLTLSIGYLVWVTKDIKDGRLLRALTETFAISYGLQALAMLRAQFSSPDGHSYFHWLILLLFASVSGLYSFCRFSRKMKDFELPGFGRDDWKDSCYVLLNTIHFILKSPNLYHPEPGSATQEILSARVNRDQYQVKGRQELNCAIW